ncbi:helix-turn-helix and ligand-binding sensor domain-containing protein [Aquimarina sp. 2201CG14-23]|uniref:helix-turn-helix and ligand-binding sensor domain-containing protein n=1 Tax=Aquimarina mycalae TaxID=3040073 RepID=UPI002477F757|nr:two-component regulator propeller domain-containing protein [Aquimarina sp. 2201CG14-23]MDH7447938.1 LuxR C-terminal-related transcriptional regulator [Aquimarina sp. 2201CG14-23]
MPKITHYDTKNMGFNAQSWDIKQDGNGLIYIANGRHVLTFDGTGWESVITNPEMVNRSLFVKNKDSIYFGADGHHGLLIKNGYGDYNVLPLRNNKKDVAADIEEYWRTHYVNDEIIFQTFRNLYVNQDNIITKIPAPYRFKWSYKIDEHIYVNDLKYGVFKLSETNLIPIISDPKLNENIIGVTKIQEDLIIITDTKGLYKFIDNQLIPITFPVLDELKKAQIFSFVKLKDNRIALGTVSNGLYILNLATGDIENINKQNGLQNNTILSIYQDDEDNLWLALDYGVDHVKLNSPLKYFYDYYGELGTTYAVVKEQDVSYLGTNQGLYITDNTTSDTTKEFELLINGQVWNIEKVEDKIYVGHDKGAYAVDGKNLTRMGEDLGAWNFRNFKMKKGNDVVISGNYNGISLYEKNQDSWEGYKLKGFEKSGRYLEIDEDNNVWVALRSEGVFRFSLDYANKELKNEAFYPITDFGKERLSLSKIENEIVITSNFNSYTYDKKNDTFTKVEIGENRGYAPRIFKKDDETWYLDNEKIVVEDKEGITVLHELEDQMVPDVLNVFSLNGQNEIIPVFNGFAMYSKDSKTISESIRSEVLIRNFVSVNSGKSYAMSAEIPFSDNDLKINYALPIYGEEIEYQTNLNEGDWSAWTTATEQTLFNLKEASYTFNVRAKYNGGYRESSFDFIIKPPIYRTHWAYLLYLLLFLSLIVLMVGINRYKMKKQERILLEQKAEKLQKQEEEHKAHKLEQEHKIIELNNSKLQDEIKAKSRELTQIAYVNLNKNKILKKIRDKIIKVQDASPQKLPTNSYNELVRLVEYYITDKESKLFEINFDKSHQEFYEKLSKNYPNLTSKDLRLCAYLKMNLSSKEIAPLLGISSQSVDVSRHRLRKKLNLGSKDNLTNILISLK